MTYIIAELGINHNNDPGRAKALVQAAKDAGADAVKVQYFDEHYSPKLEGVAYGVLVEAKWAADSAGIGFGATVFQPEHVCLIEDGIGLDFIKVASPDLTNHALIREVRKHPLIILSTGASYSVEMEQAIREAGSPWCLMHCRSAYPADFTEWDVDQIKAMDLLWDTVGYSDHTPHLTSGARAVSLGCSVIEKHLDLDDKAGPDGPVSLMPEQFAQYVRFTREGAREPMEDEMAVRGNRAIQDGIHTRRLVDAPILEARPKRQFTLRGVV